MEAKNLQEMAAVNVLGALATLNPVLLHVSGLAFIWLVTYFFRTNKKWLRVLFCAVFAWATTILMIAKTKTDMNLYRLMRVSRYSMDKDIHHGLDRLESVLDIETVQEMEGKLTGRAANYFLKGHDLFGDTFSLLDYTGKLSVSKQAKGYKILADFIVFFYSSFSLHSEGSHKGLKILQLLVVAYLLLLNLKLYDLYPEYTESLPTAEEMLKFHAAFSCYAVFNLSDLLSMCASSTLLTGLLWSRLQPEPTWRIRSDFEEVEASPSERQFDEGYALFVEKYERIAEETANRERRNTYVIKGVAVVMALLLGFSWYEGSLGSSAARQDNNL